MSHYTKFMLSFGPLTGDRPDDELDQLALALGTKETLTITHDRIIPGIVTSDKPSPALKRICQDLDANIVVHPVLSALPLHDNIRIGMFENELQYDTTHDSYGLLIVLKTESPLDDQDVSETLGFFAKTYGETFHRTGRLTHVETFVYPAPKSN